MVALHNCENTNRMNADDFRVPLGDGDLDSHETDSALRVTVTASQMMARQDMDKVRLHYEVALTTSRSRRMRTQWSQGGARTRGDRTLKETWRSRAGEVEDERDADERRAEDKEWEE